jgi:hypothetical protein
LLGWGRSQFGSFFVQAALGSLLYSLCLLSSG